MLGSSTSELSSISRYSLYSIRHELRHEARALCPCLANSLQPVQHQARTKTRGLGLCAHASRNAMQNAVGLGLLCPYLARYGIEHTYIWGDLSTLKCGRFSPC